MTKSEKLLFSAAKNGDIKTLQTLIKQGVNVNATTPNKWTALMLAALHGQTETVRCLLGHRTKGHRAKRQAANPYATLKNSAMNAFLFAVRSGNADTVRLLLDKVSIDINHQSEYELRDDERYTIMPTPLMLAARYGHTDVMKLLIEKGADVSIIEKALSLVTKHGHIASVRLLFELGLANANSTDHWETPILTIASGNGHKDLVQFLLDNGAEVNRLGGFWGYETAIRDAVFGNHIEIVQLLLDAGADVNLGEKIGNLKSNNAQPVLVLYMVCDTYGEKINMDMLKLLLDAGVNVNAMDNLHETALYKAAENGDIDAVRLLLDYGADVNLGRETPLIAALYDGGENTQAKAIVQLLIDNGADVHRCTDIGLWSTVMLAAVNHPECLQLLIDAGADINYVCRGTTDYYQYTALLWVAEEGITESVKILLANGADIHAKNKRGRTALDLAMTEQHTEIVQLLQAAGAKNSENYSPQTAQAEKKKSEEQQMLEAFQAVFGAAIAENKYEIAKIYQQLFMDKEK